MYLIINTPQLGSGRGEDLLGEIGLFLSRAGGVGHAGGTGGTGTGGAAGRGQNNLLSGLRAIGVVNSHPSFTTLRVAITVANTLGYAWGIPVFSLTENDFSKQPLILLSDKNLPKRFKLSKKSNKFKPVMPVYSGEPNISRPRV